MWIWGIFRANNNIRDRPFNLQRGGMVFCFVQNFFLDNTRVRIFIFFCRVKHKFFFPEFNIRFFDKNSESDYFFSSTKIRIFFSATLGIRIFFLEKNHNPSFKLNGLSLSNNCFTWKKNDCFEFFVFLFVWGGGGEVLYKLQSPRQTQVENSF